MQFAQPAAKAEVVGAMTALQTKILGARGKSLSVGSQISLGDHLRSNKTGLGMIVFNDESSAKIGPNSNLTIDEFVYQPGRSKGTIGVQMKQGLVRFYGGQISKAGKMQITTPHIVLGVRGGILDTKVGKLSTLAILRAGQMFCNVNGKIKIITKPGFACISDGTSLILKLMHGDDLALLDSLDRIAGIGVPGRFGTGINGRTACAMASHDSSTRCKSMYGNLPGLGGKTGSGRNPFFPLGSKIIPPETVIVNIPDKKPEIIYTPPPTPPAPVEAPVKTFSITSSIAIY